MAETEIKDLSTHSGFAAGSYLATQNADGTGGKIASSTFFAYANSGHNHDSSYAAIAHASSHASGGSDSVKLDDLASPDDNTDLDVSTSAHGLCPKADNNTSNFLRGDGSWNGPTPGDTLPIDDTTAVVRDPVDNTKLVRIDVGAITTGTTRVITMPDRNVDLSDGGTFAELAHASAHASGASDAIKLDDLASPDDNTDLDVSTSAHGLCPKLDNNTSNFLRGDGSWTAPPAGGLPVDDTTTLTKDPVDNTKLMRIDVGAVATGTTRLLTMPDRDVDLSNGGTFAEKTHASTHQSGGADAIKLDDLASPDDNTDLDVSTSAHGLCPKLDNNTSNFLRGDGSWSPPSATAIKPTLIFSALHSQADSSFTMATVDTRNGHPVLDFDDSTDEYAIFAGVLPTAYNSGGVTVKVHWTAATATSGDAVWAAAFERVGATQDIDADSFGSAQTTTTTTSGTCGVAKITTITFTDGAQIDSLAAGEGFRLQVCRDADNGFDTMSGDAELLFVEVYES